MMVEFDAKTNSWISLNDDGFEPLFEDDYLVAFDDGFMTVVHYDGKDWDLWADSGEPVAWQYLPVFLERSNEECD